MMQKQTSSAAGGNTPSAESTDRVDLIRMSRILWDGRRSLLKITAVFMAIGLLLALTGKKEYTASVTVVPQSAQDPSRLSELSGLASMAGINLNMASSTTINPAVYPRIVRSPSFQLELMKTRMPFSEIGQNLTLYDYFTRYDKPGPVALLLKYTLGLPGLIGNAVRGRPAEPALPAQGDTLIRFSDEQRKVREKLDDLITIDYNEKDGYVTLACVMPEAEAAARLARRTQELLQRYITEFKTQKAIANLSFIEQRYFEAVQKYNKAQEDLARFRDKNKNVSKALAQTELERLSNAYNLSFSIYQELAKQLEQANIQVKQDTPVFTVIEPASVPSKRSKPKRTLILLAWTLAGAITAAGYLFLQHFMNSYRQRWNEPE